MPAFDPSIVDVGFVVDKVSLQRVSLRVIRSSLVSIVPPMSYTNSSVTQNITSSTDSVVK